MALQKRHYYGKALNLIKKIELLIGYDKKTGLIRDGSSENLLDTFENSSFAIANCLAGRKEVAVNILKSIEENIGFDGETGLVYNKIGLSKNENKMVLPGEKTIFLANNVLISILYDLLGENDKSIKIRKNIDDSIGTFEYNDRFKIYRHEPKKDIFYPFNNILVGLTKYSNGHKTKGKQLVKDIETLCSDNKMGLLMAEPKSKLYFTLDNALFSSYLSISGKEKRSEQVIKTIENKIGFDKETGLAYRGILGSIGLIAPKDIENTANIKDGLKNNHQIKDVLTYANSHLAISYLCLAGNYPK